MKKLCKVCNVGLKHEISIDDFLDSDFVGDVSKTAAIKFIDSIPAHSSFFGCFIIHADSRADLKIGQYSMFCSNDDHVSVHFNPPWD